MQALVLFFFFHIFIAGEENAFKRVEIVLNQKVKRSCYKLIPF